MAKLQQLSRATKFKLAVPVLYLCLAVTVFILSWPKHPTWHDYAGVVITLTAFALWITARVQLGNAFTIAPDSKFLVTTGIYSKLRHPVYYFSILAVIGLALYMWQTLMIVVIVTLVTLEAMRISEEERVLAKAFGKQYTEYKKTSWF